LKISTSKENLLKPSSEWVKIKLENLTEFFTGKNVEFICQPKFYALNCFLHPELHEDSIILIVKHRYFQELLFSSGYTGFSIRDYFFPDFSKVRKIFSAVINFAKFREEFLTFLKNFTKCFGKNFFWNWKILSEINSLEEKFGFLFAEILRRTFSKRKFEEKRRLLKIWSRTSNLRTHFCQEREGGRGGISFLKIFLDKFLEKRKKNDLLNKSFANKKIIKFSVRFLIRIQEFEIEKSFLDVIKNSFAIENCIKAKIKQFKQENRGFRKKKMLFKKLKEKKKNDYRFEFTLHMKNQTVQILRGQYYMILIFVNRMVKKKIFINFW